VGRFKKEIVPVPVPNPKGGETMMIVTKIRGQIPPMSNSQASNPFICDVEEGSLPTGQFFYEKMTVPLPVW